MKTDGHKAVEKAILGIDKYPFTETVTSTSIQLLIFTKNVNINLNILTSNSLINYNTHKRICK